jgi:hypothetical protein
VKVSKFEWAERTYCQDELGLDIFIYVVHSSDYRRSGKKGIVLPSGAPSEITRSAFSPLNRLIICSAVSSFVISPTKLK